MSTATVDVDRVELVVQAVVRDWVKLHYGDIIVSEPNLRELYEMLVDELKSARVVDSPLIRIDIREYRRGGEASIDVRLPRNRVKCVATLGVARPWIRGEATENYTHASASVVHDPEKPVTVTCEPLEPL
jgi:hypothetical protein